MYKDTIINLQQKLHNLNTVNKLVITESASSNDKIESTNWFQKIVAFLKSLFGQKTADVQYSNTPDTSYFVKNMFTCYDSISNTWNLEIVNLAKQLEQSYIKNDTDITESLKLKAIIYNHLYFENKKSDILNMYYTLNQNDNFVKNFNELVLKSYKELQDQINKIVSNQLDIYHKLD